MILLSICLSEIPKSEFKVSEKNGKTYLTLVVNERKEAGKYGETHTVALSQSKEDREAKVKPTYVGNGKEYKFGEDKPAQNNAAPPYTPPSAPIVDDGLPF